MRSMKSQRHSAISGRFGENLVLYLLSKSGFECAFVDYVGIDILATNKLTTKKIGVSVKFKTIPENKPSQGILVKDIEKANFGAKVFDSEPYMAIVLDEQSHIYIFLFPTRIVDEITTSSKTKKRLNLRPNIYKDLYRKHQEVYFLKYKLDDSSWF